MDRNDSAGNTARRIADAWDADRGYLTSVASRILGDRDEAEEMVQEAFGRLTRIELDDIDDMRGWLAVVVRNLSLDRIKSAQARHETVASSLADGSLPLPDLRLGDPADRITLDDQVQLALAVVLDRLTPAERTAFVLHDIFGFSFAEVGEIVGRTAAACRQLASRARRSIRTGTPAARAEPQDTTNRLLAERFIAVCAGGDLTELIALLDPDVVGEAVLIDHGPIIRLEGRPLVAKNLVQRLGLGTGGVLVPVEVERQCGVLTIGGGRVTALLILEEDNGLIHHIHAFVRPRLSRPDRRGDRRGDGHDVTTPGSEA
jgi:RNA polymerase sigma-70 factor (ECF subfamily)